MNWTRQKYLGYLVSVSFIGSILIGWSVIEAFRFDKPTVFALFAVLAAASGALSAVRPAYGNGGVAYDVGAGLCIAAFSPFGMPGAILLSATIALSSWNLKPKNDAHWKRTYSQLIYNASMLSIASVFAFGVFRLAAGAQATTDDVRLIAGWFFATIVYEFVNRILLTIVVFLQNEGRADLRVLIQENWSDSLLTIAVHFVGAALVGYAVEHYDWRGVVIFFVPILLSSLAYLIYVRNVSNYMETLEKRVAERTSALEQVSREKDAFLRVLTHDMRSPLSVIRAYTQLLTNHPERARNKPGWLKHLAEAEKQLERMVDDISDLENWSKGSKLILEKSAIDINALLKHIFEQFQPAADDQKIVLETYCPSTPVLICVDPHYIKRILTNLVSNALKYTPSGGKIRLAVRQNESSVSIDVQDTGYGIPQEALAHIFEEFYRVAEYKGLAAGTGIGLAVVKMLVEEHGGTIEVSSTVGVGSTFTIALPLTTA